MTDTSLDHLICPQCHAHLSHGAAEMICQGCDRRWPVINGISVFSTQSPNGQQSVQPHSATGPDPRMADWKYFIPLRHSNVALVLGSGTGAVPLTLAAACAQVYVVDSVWDNLLALGQIREKQGLQNLHLAYVEGQSLPFPAGAFDLVTFDQFSQDQNGSPFTETAREVLGLLKPGGTAQFTLGNKWVRQGLLPQRGAVGHGMLSLSGYEQALRTEGFQNPQVFIPLPDHRIPLYFLPVTSPEATRHLFRALLPLIDTISPEIKAANRLRYLLVRFAAPFAKRLPTNWALKLLAPSYIAIARR